MKEMIHESLRNMLTVFCNDNPDREGLVNTPKRYLNFLDQFLNPAPFEFTTFENEGNDEMIIVKDIPFYSLCEHHLAPFFGTAAVAYVPTNKIAGLSKLPRVVDMYARRLQNQERITQQVATYISEQLKAKGVAVVVKARHLCIEMRGIQKPGCETTTSAMLGIFKTQLNTRQEFLNLLK